MDYPPVPPGVRTFDPRRLRRHNRALLAASQVQRAKDEKRIQEAEKKALLQALHNEQRKNRIQAEKASKGFLSKVKSFFSRRAQ